jgi:hypothetical protein
MEAMSVEMSETMRALSDELAEAKQQLRTLTEQHAQSDVERSKLFAELLTQNEELKTRIAIRDQDIRIMKASLEECDRATDGQVPRWPLTVRDVHPGDGDREPVRSQIDSQAQHALHMFYNGHDLSSLCSVTDLYPNEVFRKLQTLLTPPRAQLPDAVELPVDWRVSCHNLSECVPNSRFLFSAPVLEGFGSCETAQELAVLLTQAFVELSRQPDRDWRPMAIFVMDMCVKRCLYRAHRYTNRNRDGRVSRLESTRGKLLRQCRNLHARYNDYVSENRVRLRRLSRSLQVENRCAPRKEFDLGNIVSSDSRVRTDVFREMIDLSNVDSQPRAARRYSDNIFHMAVVLLFRSRSAYEFLRMFLPLPAPSTVYGHFDRDLKDSLARLQSVDAVGEYLDARIAREPVIAQGAVLAVDAVSCANTFVGMKEIQEGEVAYLFVIHLQPLIPGPKCSPLFMIESESGMADKAVQNKIDEILEVARSRILRVFIASDGDPSYNDRHHIFLLFWEPIYEQWGLERVLTELTMYDAVLPLSDLLHLGKNFRTRFLKYMLTFTFGNSSRSIDPNKMRQILDLGAPLTDLTQVGKMRDAYPLVITRIAHIILLFENDAIAEGVVWLPLSLCFNAIRLENITRETRVFMLRVSFFLVRIAYENRRNGFDKNPETSKKKGTTLFTSQWSVRFLDTVLLLIFSIENYNCLAIEHESTQPLENFFGFMRMQCHDINTTTQMTSTIVHTDIVKEANRVLEVKQRVRGRANLAGVHIGDTPEDATAYHIEMANLIPPETIARICLQAVHAQDGSLTPDEIIAFLQFREYLCLLKKAADESQIANEINTRFIFGSASRIVRLITSHGTARRGIGQ